MKVRESREGERKEKKSLKKGGTAWRAFCGGGGVWGVIEYGAVWLIG